MRLRMTVVVLLMTCAVHASPVAAEGTTPADGISSRSACP